MRSPVTRLLIFWLCCGSVGLLLVTAWTNMAVTYSAENGLSEGLSMTFDQRHPCRFCQALETGEDDSEEREQTKPEKAPEKGKLKSDCGADFLAQSLPPPAFVGVWEPAWGAMASLGLGRAGPEGPPPRIG
jgi:hypothetical protein